MFIYIYITLCIFIVQNVTSEILKGFFHIVLSLWNSTHNITNLLHCFVLFFDFTTNNIINLTHQCI